MTIDQFINLTKKHGALGVISAWLFFTNIKVNSLENMLYNCYKREYTLHIHSDEKSKNLLAILPKQLDAKKRSYVD